MTLEQYELIISWCGHRLMKYMQQVRAEIAFLAEWHLDGGPWGAMDDSYAVTQTATYRRPCRGVPDVLICLTICDRDDYEPESEGIGVNFEVLVTERDGRILGQFSPFNYTPDCWVDAADEAAVLARLSDLEAISPALVAACLERYQPPAQRKLSRRPRDFNSKRRKKQ